MIDSTIHCEYCQSYPDSYICCHTKNQLKECMYVYCDFNPFWEAFPCNLMDGEIRLHKHGGGYEKIAVKQGAFIEQ